MSLAVYFTVEGQAVGKGRPRVSTIGGRPRMYTPAKTVAWERLVAEACRSAMGTWQPSEHPMAVRINIRVGVPISWTVKRQVAALNGDAVPGKPDLDNVAKAILDACNGIAYIDDKQVARLTVSKFYSTEPGVEVYMPEVVQ
jgi:Holliday junction resolvase RusA-like endonuclease